MKHGNWHLPAKWGAVEKLTISGTSAKTGAFSNGTRVVRFCGSVACHVAIGADPTATANDTYIPANEVEYIEVFAGHKLAAIQASGGGFATVTELA